MKKKYRHDKINQQDKVRDCQGLKSLFTIMPTSSGPSSKEQRVEPVLKQVPQADPRPRNSQREEFPWILTVMQRVHFILG